MEEWSDSRKFWTETCRTVLFGVIGAIVATVILGSFSDASKSQRDIRAHAIDTFMNASNDYTDQMRSDCGRKAGSGNGFEPEFKKNYHSARHALRIYFDDSSLQPYFDKAIAIEANIDNLCSVQPSQEPTAEEESKKSQDVLHDVREMQIVSEETAKVALRHLEGWWHMLLGS